MFNIIVWDGRTIYFINNALNDVKLFTTLETSVYVSEFLAIDSMLN